MATVSVKQILLPICIYVVIKCKIECRVKGLCSIFHMQP